MRVEQALVVSLLPAAGQAGDVDVGRRLAAALAARGIGRLATLVAAERTHVELRQLSVPPCPADELPDVVRFQAIKEFNALRDDWPLDFIPLAGDPPQSVLAAAADPAWVGQIQSTLTPAGLQARRLVLRPCATASLWRRTAAGTSPDVCLLVDLLGQEAELTVLFGQREFFLRSARLPTDSASEPDARASLGAEIRRSMGAVQNQLGGRRVQAIVLVGSAEQGEETAAELAQELGVSVEWFDPLARVDAEGAAREVLAEQPGRFAALLGMAWDELDRTPPAIDFLHPRRRQEPQGRRTALALAGLAAALVFLCIVGYGWWSGQEIDRQTRALTKELRELEPKVKAGEETRRAVAEVERWVNHDVVWLDEMRWLCDRLPPAEDVMLDDLQLRLTTSGGEATLQGFARSVETIKRMESKLRDDRHRIEGRAKWDDSSRSPYTRRFRSRVLIDGEER